MPRPAVQSFRGAIQPVAFSRDLRDALKFLSRREGATLFMTLLAGFATLLHRYSSCEDVVIGTVTSGRKRSELEGLLGYFLNPVVLRNDLSGDPTFREFLRRTRNVALDALSNDDAPFTHVVNDLASASQPEFQSVISSAADSGATASESHGRVDGGADSIGSRYRNFEVRFVPRTRRPPSGSSAVSSTAPTFSKPATVARMAGHLTTLLQSIIANPEQRISKLPVLTAGERQQICVEWNDTGAEFPADLCLHQLVTRQAERTPEAPALLRWEWRTHLSGNLAAEAIS